MADARFLVLGVCLVKALRLYASSTACHQHRRREAAGSESMMNTLS